MLKRFEVQNFKNFKDKFVFDLSETKNYEFNTECVQNGVVNKAIIYGVNGCGKSNLGLAILDISNHLTNVPFLIPSYQNYLNAQANEATAKFKFVFQFDQNEVCYIYEKTAVNKLTFEQLYINGIEVIFYASDLPLCVNLKGAETLRTDLQDSNVSSAIGYVARNTVLEKNETNDAFGKFFRFASKMGIAITSSLENSGNAHRFTKYILQRENLDEFEVFLNNAGVACQLKAIDINGEQDIAFVFEKRNIPFWDIASTGTKSLARFYCQKLRLESEDAHFIFIDEFDAFYHHKLSELIVNELKNVATQVILTTHNTSIMTNDLLRPDCYFVMHENKIDPIYKFTDKELRFAHNIEKMYKAGAFDG